jgi:hypothetical protein
MPVEVDTPTAKPVTYENSKEAERNWQRYQYAKRRGHTYYVNAAARCEGFYLGGGLQWTAVDRQRLRDTGDRPAYEFNEIMPGVNGAVGYQIHNRLDISFLPRGGMADSNMASIRSKVAMQILDHNKFHWKETQVFSDGLIEQRGYFDIRMGFDSNVFGDAEIRTLDPRDVIPDPDAKSYEPEDWYDVTITRWYNIDEIEEFYGKEARNKVQFYLDNEGDWGETDDDGPRNKFGDEGPSVQTWDIFLDDVDARKFRILDRQRWKYELVKVAIYPTGDVKPIGEATPEQVQEYVAQGAVISKRMQRNIQWTVTTRFATLHDEISPYDRFTVIPYFCYFRRGKTRGMVDNAIGPQEVLNKSVSQFVHILNTSANSGWIIEENSLVGMSTEDVEDQGSKTGLVLVYKQGSKEPKKIEPNKVPSGLDRLIDHAHVAIKQATIPDEMKGMEKQELSGIAIQTKQFAAQNQLAIPLDNLARTRHMVADFLDYLISNFYDNARQFRITETDPHTGKEVTANYNVNQYNRAKRVWENDLTEGDYDVVVSEQPMQITFENSQFEQAMELKKAGVNIPDNIIIKHSNLADKSDILDQMQNQGPPPMSPLDQAKASLAQAQSAVATAQADKVQAEASNVRVTAQFGTVQAAQVIAQLPAVAPLADELARSAGIKDQNQPPEIPTPAAGAMPAAAAPVGPAVQPIGTPGVPGEPRSTNPLHPATPGTGERAGIEGGQP